MRYIVFLDTNIYETANFSFGNGLFTQLRELGKAGLVQLQINKLVESEILFHIESKVKEAVDELTKAVTQPAFAGFKKMVPYDSLLTIPEADNWIASLITEYRGLLSDCSCKMITMNGVDMEAIVDDYRNRRLPFQAKKPDEFKDAIIIRSILNEVKDMDEDDHYYVVSADRGFRTAIKRAHRAENFQVLSDLPKLLEAIVMRETEAEYYKTCIEESISAIEAIQDAVEEAIYNANINIYTVPDYVEDISLDSVEDIEYAATIIALHEGMAKVSISATCTVQVSFSYVDEDNSYYDKEDQAYLWKTIVERQDTARIETDLIVSLDVSSCGEEVPEDERYIEFVEYIDIPDSIDIEEDNLVDYEILSESDPFDDGEDGREYAETICPDCGTPIGIKNDGGNGFCINCAPNH